MICSSDPKPVSAMILAGDSVGRALSSNRIDLVASKPSIIGIDKSTHAQISELHNQNIRKKSGHLPINM